MESETMVVKVSPSTKRWLEAFARSNSHSTMHPAKITAEEIVAQAAFCIADYAGRRMGSWEADVGGNLCISSGFQEPTMAELYDRCSRADEDEKRKHREKFKLTRPANTNSGPQDNYI